MNKSLLSFLVVLICCFWNCSENNSAGSSSSENAKVLAGIVLDTNGLISSNDTIVLRDIKSTEPLITSITDNAGQFSFSVEGIPEFSILLKSSDDHSVYKRYSEFAIDTLWDTLSIVKNGTIEITCDIPINRESDSLFILGTDKKISLKNATFKSSGQWNLTINNLPAADLSSVVISSKNGIQEIAPTLKVFSNESSSVVIEDNKSLHQWNIQLTVSVKQVIVDNFVGLDSMKVLINNQLASASNIITELSELPGVFNFYADSFYVFTGSAITEGNKPLGAAAHRLIYTDSTLDSRLVSRLPIGTRLHYMWLYSGTYSFFEQWDLELLVHLLSEGRGAVPLQYQNVVSGNYPVNHNGYMADSCVMNKSSYSNYMTDYTKMVLLNNHSVIGNEREILKKAIPQFINIIDSTYSVNTISVFGSLITTDTLQRGTVANLAGIVNEEGTTFTLSQSDFLNNEELLYSTLFLVSNTGKYRWLSLSEMAEGWFNGNENVFTIYF